MPDYFMLVVADTPPTEDTVLLALDHEGRPQPAYGSPRAIQVSDLMDNYHGLDFYDLVVRNETTVQVLRVTPQGQVRPHHEFFDMDADIDADMDEFRPEDPVEAENGWQVAEVLGLADVMGPQGQQVIDALHECLRLEGVDGGLEAYGTAVDALYADPDPDVSPDRAYYAARGALDAIGVDTYWWGTVGCVFGHEAFALAARDLIGTHPGWDQAAYDLLTRPWRATITHLLHADDKPLTAAGHRSPAE
jgi:hypothetical protein